MNVRTPAFGVYLMAGEALPEQAAAVVEAGATMIEVGLPFSDSLADGPTVQKAAHAALAAGVTTRSALAAMAATRQRLGDDVPLVPMTSVAIVERYGVEAFCEDAAAAGANGLILPDMPPEEAGEVDAAAAPRGIDLVHLVTLTSSEPRIALACEAARGFLYVVNAVGVTGARESLDEQRLGALLARVRAHAASKPLLCGFGISRPEHVRGLRAAGADGIIVGSAALNALEAGGVPALRELVAGLAAALAEEPAGVST
jgi:tryptophan synthase alpha chain